ncbi:hypothetical protein NMG60_11030308 [Bertholletia excelsa]
MWEPTVVNLAHALRKLSFRFQYCNEPQLNLYPVFLVASSSCPKLQPSMNPTTRNGYL